MNTPAYEKTKQTNPKLTHHCDEIGDVPAVRQVARRSERKKERRDSGHGPAERGGQSIAHPQVHRVLGGHIAEFRILISNLGFGSRCWTSVSDLGFGSRFRISDFGVGFRFRISGSEFSFGFRISISDLGFGSCLRIPGSDSCFGSDCVLRKMPRVKGDREGPPQGASLQR